MKNQTTTSGLLSAEDRVMWAKRAFRARRTWELTGSDDALWEVNYCWGILYADSTFDESAHALLAGR